jgi:hypothetical protein
MVGHLHPIRADLQVCSLRGALEADGAEGFLEGVSGLPVPPCVPKDLGQLGGHFHTRFGDGFTGEVFVDNGQSSAVGGDRLVGGETEAAWSPATSK